MALSQSPSPLTRFGFFFLVGGVTLVLAFWGVLHYLAGHQPKAAHARQAVATPVPASRPTPAATPSAEAERAEAAARLNETIAQALAVLRDPHNLNKKAALDALKAALRGADPKVAVAVIRKFLDGKEDAKTGLGFRVGENHELEDAPTMRTFLMDQLGDISLGAGLPDAAEVARTTLASKDSSDEWALAMRNLALADPDGSRAFLAGKAKEMLEYAPWQGTPSGGYLEAFDVAAYAADASVIPDMAPLLSSPTSSLDRASRIALQRLSTIAPDQVASYLNGNPGTLADYPLLRADYMGSLNLSSPDQLAQAEAYLGRTDVSDAEKSKFLAREAVPAGFVSDTLVTPSNTQTMGDTDHRALVNQVASQWLASGKYPDLQAALQKTVATTTDTNP